MNLSSCQGKGFNAVAKNCHSQPFVTGLLLRYPWDVHQLGCAMNMLPLRRSYFSNMLHTWNQQFNCVWSNSMFASNRDSCWIDPVFFLSEELLQVASSWQCSDRRRRCPHMLRREAAGAMDGKELVIWHGQHLQHPSLVTCKTRTLLNE